MATPESPAQTTARYAAIQSVTEIGLGSAVHAWHIPLGGHVLSLNQGLILAFASRQARTRRAGAAQTIAISSVAGLMKLLSPAGKRVMPMVAILIQGILYSAGLALGGLNAAGCALGMVFLAVWGFAQPLLFAFLLYGQTFFHALEKLWSETAAKLGIDPVWGLRLLIAVVSVKLLAALALGVFAWKAGPEFQARYLGRIEGWASRVTPKTATTDAAISPFRGAFLDLLNPWFLGSLAVTVLFVASVGQATQLYGVVARALVCAWGVFFFLRAMPIETMKRFFGRFPTVAAALDQVLRARSRS